MLWFFLIASQKIYFEHTQTQRHSHPRISSLIISLFIDYNRLFDNLLFILLIICLLFYCLYLLCINYILSHSLFAILLIHYYSINQSPHSLKLIHTLKCSFARLFHQFIHHSFKHLPLSCWSLFCLYPSSMTSFRFLLW